MATPIILVGTAPSVTTGADTASHGPHDPASIDQNMVNLRAAVDAKALLAGSSSQAFSTGALTVTGSVSATTTIKTTSNTTYSNTAGEGTIASPWFALRTPASGYGVCAIDVYSSIVWANAITIGGDATVLFSSTTNSTSSTSAASIKTSGGVSIALDTFIGGALNVGGIASAATPTQGDSTTKVATTAFVHTALGAQLYYGVSWDESADTYVRTGNLVGVACGSSPAAALIPIQSLMRRVVLKDDGTRAYYLYPTDSTKQANGITASVLDGTDGQVMVEIPKFYSRHTYSGTTHTWEISLIPLAGFTVHDTFIKNGIEVPYRYCGAYEATLQSSSTKLSSISGATGYTSGQAVADGKIYCNQTRAVFRAKAAARGTGWRQYDYDLMSAIQLLYLVEYGNFNTQAMIGAGISNVTDWPAYNNYYAICPTGLSNSIGNATGNVGTTSATCAATLAANAFMSYRGIENWYGHVWKWVDGINTNSNRSYVCNTDTAFADDTTTGYTDIGVSNCASDGYQSTLLNISRGFLPGTVGAGSSTKLGDYYYQGSGYQIAYSGGDSDIGGGGGGGFFLHLHDGSGDASSHFCGRLAY